MIAAVQNQATMQRMLAAALRAEAANLALANASRKRHADAASQFQQDVASVFN
jgi:hypothetical protein